MLKELFNLVREKGVDTVISNPDIPNEKNEAVLSDASSSVREGLQSMLSGGGTENLASLFGGQNQTGHGIGGLLNNPIVSNIVNIFKNKLTNNHGLDEDKANGVANDLIPNVIGGLVSKTNDPNDNSFNLSDIIASLTGSGAGGLNSQDALGGLKGKIDSDGDGKIELSDILQKLKGS